MDFYCTLFVVADSERPAILCGEDCSYVPLSSVAYKPVFPRGDDLVRVGVESAVSVAEFVCAEGAGVEPAGAARHCDLEDHWACLLPNPSDGNRGKKWVCYPKSMCSIICSR
jgi:hypothetical protein